MHHKHVIGAVGFFSLGALFAWAVTADRYDRKVKEAWHAGYLANDLDWVKLQPRNRPLKPPKPNLVMEETVSDPNADPNQPDLPFEEKIERKEEPVFNDSDFHDGVTFGMPGDYPDETVDDDEEPYPEGETPEETRSALQAIIDNYTANPEDRDEFVYSAQRLNGDARPPYVISRQEYAWGEDAEGYAKITLTYYPKDRVLLDDDNDPIDDISGVIGWRSLSNFGGESGDPSVVFVRNDKLLTDFEVIRDDEAELPLHVKYGMSEEEFNTNKAAGTLKLRREDE